VDAKTILFVYGTLKRGERNYFRMAGQEFVAEATTAARYRVIVPDLRGHGETDWAEPPSYLIENFAADLDALLGVLGIERVATLGHSMGGRIAAWMAAEMGHRAWACGLLETRMSALSQERVDSWRGARIGQGQRRGYATKAEALASFRITPDEPGVAVPLRIHLAEHAVVQQDNGAWVLRFIAALNIEGSRVADFFPLLARITCPTLVLRGESSTVLGEAVCAATVATLRRGEAARLPGGHHCVLAQPTAASAILTDFLARAFADR
jgi:pimeloyl-ACP methyl ester carboxylesterase